MQRLFELSMETDLLPFSAFLWREGIAHRITEEGGRQVLWLENPANAAQVEQFFADWQAGLLQLGEVKVQWWKRHGLMSGPLADWKRIPATLLFLVACLVVAFITRLGNDYQTVAWFSFLNFDIAGEYIRFVPLSYSLSHGEYWRLLSPIFLHFGILHLAFNMLWLLEFGRRLELTPWQFFPGAFDRCDGAGFQCRPVSVWWQCGAVWWILWRNLWPDGLFVDSGKRTARTLWRTLRHLYVHADLAGHWVYRCARGDWVRPDGEYGPCRWPAEWCCLWLALQPFSGRKAKRDERRMSAIAIL